MKTYAKRLVWVGVIAAVALGGYVAVRGQALPVEVTSPQRQTVRAYVIEDAKTRLNHEYTIDMPVTGTLRRIALEVGDEVTKGDIIAQVDPYDLQQRIRELESVVESMKAQMEGVDVAKPKEEDIATTRLQMTEAETNLEIARKSLTTAQVAFETAKKAFERAQTLNETGAVSESYFDDANFLYQSASEELKGARLREDAAQKGVEVARLAHERMVGSIDDNEYVRDRLQAEIDRVQAQLAVLRNDLEKTDVRAPVSGPILQKLVSDERVLAPGTPILTLGDLNSLEIECDVLSEEVVNINVGNAVEITGKALKGRELTGTVSRIYPAGFTKISSLGIEQQRVRTIIDCPECASCLRPGTSVDVRIITEASEDALAVPDHAAIRVEGAWSVFRVVDGEAVLTPITVGLRNDVWVEVKEGLSESDIIVAEPKNALSDGAAVSPMPYE